MCDRWMQVAFGGFEMALIKIIDEPHKHNEVFAFLTIRT
jgi:hypothetical protein